MPRLWQFPATAPTFTALPQPDPPGSGFESNSPPILRRRPTQAGDSFFPLAPQPFIDPVPRGGEAVFPPKLPRRAMPGGTTALIEKFPPVYVFLGYDPVSPAKMKRAAMPPTFEHHPENQPPAATAHDPLGWEPLFPWKLPRRRADLGQDSPLRHPAAVTAANPIGWTISAPTGLPRHRTDAGQCEFTLFLPPAQTSAFPTGWESVAPPSLPRSHGATGFVTPPWILVPAATAGSPSGWEPFAPVRVAKATWVPGWAYVPADPMGALTFANPLGWTISAPVTMLRGRDSAPVGTFQPFDTPPTQVSGNPTGWEPVAPVGMPRRAAPPVATYVPSDLMLPATNSFPLGWEPIAPVLLRKRPNDGTFQLQFGFGALTPITIWYSFPASMPRLYQRPGAFEVPFLAPFQPVEGWAAIAPVGMPRPPVEGFVAETHLPIIPPSAWNEFPDRAPKLRSAPGWVSAPFVLPRPVAWFECLYPHRGRTPRPRSESFYADIWRAIDNPTVYTNRIEFGGTIVTRLVFTSPIVQRKVL